MRAVSHIFHHTRGKFTISLLVGLCMGAALATFLAITGVFTGSTPRAPLVRWMLLVDAGLLVTLALLILRQLLPLWRTFVTQRGPSSLQRKVVMSFGLVTALPALAVSLFSVLLFNLGIQAWFNERVNTAVEESLAVAQAYVSEHRENIRDAAVGMADDIQRFMSTTVVTNVELNRFISAQATRRSIGEVVVFQNNRIVAQGRFSFSLAFESLPINALDRARSGEVVILQPGPGEEDRVRALIRLSAIDDAYLLVGRLIDLRVISHMEKTQGAVTDYRSLLSQLGALQWSFSAVLAILTLVLILTAVWYGLVFATRITAPMARLAGAAERVRAGDYSGRVEVGAEAGEVADLAGAFNRMVDQIGSQRADLILANRELDARRHFMETVLAGVSAGVLALDHERKITLLNRSAAAILGETGDTPLAGRAVHEVLPNLHELLSSAEAASPHVAQGSVTLEDRTLHVRVSVETDTPADAAGAIVTFDDITPLVTAQRHAAWSDVARRVAHEIKNPLTPIALSAERLRRKYLKYMEGEDAESFTRYVDTIGRHVADIGRMVEEFVSFARMPGAVMKESNLTEIVKRALFSAQVAHPAIHYRYLGGSAPMLCVCDERQIAQVLTNVLKNAAEAIEAHLADQEPTEGKGEIVLSLVAPEGSGPQIVIEDNGPGFPADKIHAMLEPYVTTRARGTGLGLAIVKKIMEEHKGNLILANRPTGGAQVTLSFPPQCDINAA